MKSNLGEPRNFIEQFIEEDLAESKHGGTVHTRFPPEPNGYLHIGHAKAIYVNFTTASKYGGKTNLRFDDTNPSTEETQYVEAIKRDIKWLGFDWEDREYYASDYFDELYELARKLISKGLAYVDDSSPQEIAEQKGTPTQPGTESPYRSRSIGENLDLFERMKEGEFPDGSRVLRAKIDMSSPNMHMRDPVLYRIKKEPHHRTGHTWNIYPMYDFAHGQSDALEEITHSLCSLEFRHHRPLYNWLIQELEIFPSRQIEFARMNVAYVITSKRKLRRLIEEGYVDGWDDPRMPTIAGMRRRGYPAAAIREFCDRAGIAKRDNVIEYELLEFTVREELNRTAHRVMGVLDPLKVVITNYPEDQVEEMEIENNPEDDDAGKRKVPFSREIYIEKEDFKTEAPNKKYFRMAPGRNVRLKGAYILHCEGYKAHEETGEIEEVYCTYYPDSRSGQDTSGIKAKGTLHWVSKAHAIPAQVNLYDRLFLDPSPDSHPEKDFVEFLNPDSLKVLTEVYLEPRLQKAEAGQLFQFMRKGYFCVDADSQPGALIFNRTVTLKDSWSKKRK